MDQRRRASACTVHISIECFLTVCAMDSRSFRDPSQSVIQILNHQAVAVCDFRRFILSVVFVSCLINGSSSNALFKAGKVIVLIIAYFRRVDFTVGVCGCFSYGPVCQIVFAPDRCPRDFVLHLGHFSVITIRIMITHTGRFVKADICEPFKGVITIPYLTVVPVRYTGCCSVPVIRCC